MCQEFGQAHNVLLHVVCGTMRSIFPCGEVLAMCLFSLVLPCAVKVAAGLDVEMGLSGPRVNSLDLTTAAGFAWGTERWDGHAYSI